MKTIRKVSKNRSANPVIYIRRSKGLKSLGLGEVWEYKDLLWFNILKNIKTKYRQMALGPLWIILQPILNTILFVFIFGKMAKMDSGGVPYPLLIFSAIIPWNYFQNSCTYASNSLVVQMPIISKVYFPRIIVPLSDALSWLVDFFVTFCILILMMFYYGIYPDIKIVFIPLYLLFVFMTTMAVSLWTASLAVQFRDLKYVVEYGLRILMFLSPVAYTSSKLESAVPIQWHWIIKMNPLYWVIEGFRWILLGANNGPEIFIVYPIIMVIVLLFSGVYVFRKTEGSIVDLN